MERIIEFKDSIISGVDKNYLVELLPALEDCFTQRKQYHEYYTNSKKISLTLEELDSLSQAYIIELSFDTLTIKS